MLAGTPLMKPMSFLLLMTRTPMCQSRVQPGGCNALYKYFTTKLHTTIKLNQEEKQELVM